MKMHTILAAAAPDARPTDVSTPGHIFPLRARDGGVLVRAGQTEGMVDLCRLAGLRAAAGPDVRFPGYVFGDGYAELVRGAGVMAAPTEVGGTHPVIVEALAGGAPLVVSDHPPNVLIWFGGRLLFACDSVQYKHWSALVSNSPWRGD